MFAIRDRVRSKSDPRVTGEVKAWLTYNWNGRSGLLVRWDSGWLEEVSINEVSLERGKRSSEPSLR